MLHCDKQNHSEHNKIFFASSSHQWKLYPYAFDCATWLCYLALCSTVLVMQNNEGDIILPRSIFSLTVQPISIL